VNFNFDTSCSLL
jgi:hypothetical protein